MKVRCPSDFVRRQGRNQDQSEIKKLTAKQEFGFWGILSNTTQSVSESQGDKENMISFATLLWLASAGNHHLFYLSQRIYVVIQLKIILKRC